MKKVAITGHTRGIGKGIYDYFLRKDYEVRGFSRTNGYDLNDQNSISQIVSETLDFDIFVNNAFNHLGGFAQVQLLHDLFPHWKNKEGWIINLSSVASDFIAGRKETTPYPITKIALDSYVKQLSWMLPRINLLLIRPGRVETPLIESVPGKKLRVNDIVNIIDWILNQPKDIHINEITIRVKDQEKYKNV